MGFFKDLSEQRKGLWIFLPILGLYVFSYFQRSAVPGQIFTQLSEEGFSAEQIATISASFILVYSLSQLVVGMLADKFSGVRVVLLGGLLLGLGSLFMPMCRSLAMINFCRIVMGFGGSTMYLCLVKETDRLFGRKNFSIFLSIIYCVGYIGGMFGTLPFVWLCQKYEWRNVLLVIGAITLLAYFILVAVIAIRREPFAPVADIPLTFKPLLAIMRNPYSWLMLFCSSVNFGIYYVIQSFCGKKFLEDCGNFSSEEASAVIMFLTLSCMLTISGVGVVIKLIGNRRRPMMRIASSINLFSTVLMLATLYFRQLPSWLFVPGYLLYACASGFAMAYTMTSQEMNSRDLITTATGFNNMGNYLFVAAGSFFIGKLLDSFIKVPVAAGQAVIYPREAYIAVFCILLGISFTSFCLMLLAPETRGHYLHLKSKNI
ncbi:MAG: MFS transporter [Lentisphaeria bacterium]|nr:MFS transporter [Lentisphaeria bacterium]